MRFNVSELDPRYSFEVTGTSYFGDPQDGTVLFATGKVSSNLEKLQGHHGCLLFLETGLNLPDLSSRKMSEEDI